MNPSINQSNWNLFKKERKKERRGTKEIHETVGESIQLKRTGPPNVSSKWFVPSKVKCIPKESKKILSLARIRGEPRVHERARLMRVAVARQSISR